MFWIVKFWGEDREYIEGFFANSLEEAKEKADRLSCGETYDLHNIQMF